jgi:ubiquinone/menaquinone biosynthesis C-methylase UbiE
MGKQADPGVEREEDGFWNLYSRYYDSIYNLMPYRKLLWDTYQALDLQAGMRVLDAGCGTGNLEHFIGQKQPPAMTIDGVDFSTGMLGVAQRKCADLDWVTFRQADLCQPLPYADATFDRIVSINVLYALPERDKTLRELLRVLRPEGRMVLTSPTPEFDWKPLVADHFRRIPNIWGTWRRVRTVLRTIGVLATTALTMMIMDFAVIGRREDSGEYHSLDRDELAGLLSAHRIDGLAEFGIEPAFAEQNLLATATKAAAYAA